MDEQVKPAELSAENLALVERVFQYVPSWVERHRNGLNRLLDAARADATPKPARFMGHAPDCALSRAATCAVAIECEHGVDVCPVCDRCTCRPPSPAEWVLVPREPTPEMVGAFWRVKNGHHYHDEPPPTDRSDYAAYRAMLAASPSPEGTRERGELTADFVRALPGGKLDDSQYEEIETALDRADAPCQATDGRWLTLAERVAALTLPPVPGVDREVVARIIHPKALRTAEEWMVEPWCSDFVAANNEVEYYEAERRVALAKADAILALVSPLEGKGSSRASPSAHVASATATERRSSDGWERGPFCNVHDVYDKPMLHLTSYCGEDTPGCADATPCNDCLRMSNVSLVRGEIKVLGGFGCFIPAPSLPDSSCKSEGGES